MKKRLVGLLIAMIMVFQITSPALAAFENNTSDKAQRQIMDDYLALCDEMGTYASEDQIIAALLNKHPSLSVVESSTVTYDENGEPPTTRCSRSKLLLEKDYLVYDNDYGAYIYFGYWNWDSRNSHLSQIDDIVAFYLSDSSKLSYLDQKYAIFGYDYNNNRVASIDPENNKYSDPYMTKVFLTSGNDLGVAFSINDSVIRRGRILAPVTRKSAGSVTMAMAYHHVWSETHLTGISGNFSLLTKGFGLSVSWERTVENWTAASLGVQLN